MISLKDYPYLDKVKLGQIFGRSGQNLNYLVKRLVAEEEILPLKNGLYVARDYLLTLENTPFERELYLEYLANVLCYPSYVSLEFVASKFGLIPEGVQAISSVSVKSTRVFETSLGKFYYKNIKEDLFTGFSYINFRQFKVAVARPGKALFDLLYFRGFPSLSSLRINLDPLSGKEKQYLDNLMEKYAS